ncbi:MAG: galactose mutarotase [Gammaproteobacteria bacterium]|nr:galactose mutarotase [Gammaproteobacteria bacterium]
MRPGDSTKSIEAITLRSLAGMEVTLLNIGATIQAIRVPTESGVVDAVLGYANLDDYLRDNFYMGATVGRFANRIGAARFLIDDNAFSVDPNETPAGSCLHGGRGGFHKRFWQMCSLENEAAVHCSYVSPDGEGGFPGKLEVTVKYQIVGDYSLVIDYKATTDSDTVVNIANHAYFNLDKQQQSIDSHDIQIEADQYTPVDGDKIPSGEIRDVDGTEFDLRRRTAMRTTSSGVSQPRQFDHNFVLKNGDGMQHRVATLSSPQSGLTMHLHTTQVGLQLYTGDYLTDPFRPRAGLCLEAQGFPDAPNQPAFPSARLAPGDVYQQRTIYEFVPGKPYS